jgi:hypothetical protein
MTRADFIPLIIAALNQLGGSARIFEVCRHVYQNNTVRITQDPRVLFTWQYDIRWAAQSLRDQNVITSTPHGFWTLV